MLFLIAFWVSLAANASADPKDDKGLVWPQYKGPSDRIVVFGNSTGPSASYTAPDALADAVTGGSCIVN